MPLERFRVPRTPESRTPYVLLLLVCVGGLVYAWRALADSRAGVEIVIAGAGAAAGWAVSRYLRQRRSRAR